MSSNMFLGASSDSASSEAVLLGVPFDGTASFRSGARFGPSAIREGSHSLETYSPFLDRDLSNRDYVDWGDLEITPGRADLMIEKVSAEVREILNTGMKPVIMGGEHTCTIGVIQALVQKFPKLGLFQIDAHADYREEFMGERLSHATIMRRVSEFIPQDRIYKVGIRSGTRQELIEAGFALPISTDSRLRDIDEVFKTIPEDIELYITLDMDVFDPSLVPGVGNPEPNGMTWREFIQLMRAVSYRNIIGCDVMELAPQYDQTGVSAVVAASAVRELMLCMMP